MNSQLTNLKSSVEHMIDITINQDKVDAYRDVLSFIKVIQEYESYHFNMAYVDGYFDGANHRDLKEDYFTSKYLKNVQSTTNK